MPDPPPETNAVRPARLGYDAAVKGRAMRRNPSSRGPDFVSHYNRGSDAKRGSEPAAPNSGSVPPLEEIIRHGPARQSFQARHHFRQDAARMLAHERSAIHGR